MSHPLTDFSWASMTSQIKYVIDRIQGSPGLSEVESNLKLNLLHLETYEIKLFNPMVKEVENINVTAIELNATRYINGKPFEQGLQDLISQVKETQEELQTHGSEIMQSVRSYCFIIIKYVYMYRMIMYYTIIFYNCTFDNN